MVVGWAMVDHMRASLVTGALALSRDRGHLAPDAIFHSDRGAQCTSREMGAWSTGNGVRQSMDATGLLGQCRRRVSVSSLKNEFYHHHNFAHTPGRLPGDRAIYRGLLQPLAAPH
ncbi:hypothetical protein [Arthrobacter sp. ATA002]|uniref:hypothetical protein n=1 Tax=Arthrobacter sp. ATA002 TaxID=2991715 RepID=UPI003FA498E8